MAKTQIETGDALTKKVWEEKLFRDAVKESYFSRFMGEGPDNIVQTKTQLEKEQGDKITFGLRKRLSGDGVTGTDILEGNEERLTWHDDSVTLEMYRHAVRDRGRLDRKRAVFSISDESKMALKDWGSEKIDQLCFDAITDSPTKTFYLNSSGLFTGTDTPATASGALDATNSKLTLDFLSGIKAWVKTGGNRQQTPLRPVKVDGKECYVFLTHPDSLYDLKVSSAWQQAAREAHERGKNNPLFKGAVGFWDGIIIHEHENIPLATDGGGGAVPYAKAVFMGAQSLVWAWGKREEVVQETFDYKNEIGHAWCMISKTKKPKFNSLDFGCVGAYVARTNISGI